jgi:hypothetical protein
MWHAYFMESLTMSDPSTSKQPSKQIKEGAYLSFLQNYSIDYPFN